MIKEEHSWVSIVRGASPLQRKRLRTAVLNGIEFFNAKWKKIKRNPDTRNIPKEYLNDPEITKALEEGRLHDLPAEMSPVDWKLQGKNPKDVALARDLKNEKNFECIGFIPNVTYIKHNGTKEQLEADWVHPFGSPTLLYAHKTLPMLIIAGPDIMYNDSMIRAIKENQYGESVAGITG